MHHHSHLCMHVAAWHMFMSSTGATIPLARAGVTTACGCGVCCWCMSSMSGAKTPHVALQGEPWQDAASPDCSLTWGSAAGATAFGTPFFTPVPGSAQRPSPQVGRSPGELGGTRHAAAVALICCK